MRLAIYLAVAISAFAPGSQTVLYAGGVSPFLPCYSIQESKARGWYVCSLTFAPSVIIWKGNQIAIKAAWLEKAHERNYSWNPFAPKYKPIGGYNLCFNLSRGGDYLSTFSTAPMFLLEGRGHSFASQGTVVFYDHVETAAPRFMLYLTENFKRKGAVKITVTQQHSGTDRR